MNLNFFNSKNILLEYNNYYSLITNFKIKILFFLNQLKMIIYRFPPRIRRYRSRIKINNNRFCSLIFLVEILKNLLYFLMKWNILLHEPSQ